MKKSIFSTIETNYSEEEKLIVRLLQERFDEARDIINAKQLDFQAFDRSIKEHKIAPTVYKNLLLIDDNGIIPTDIRTYAEKRITANLVIHTYIKHQLHILSDLFASNEIDMILLKGFAIDASPLRQMTDLDVLIEEGKIDKAFAVLESIGYTYIGSFVLNAKERENPKKQYKWNNQYQFRVPQGLLAVEVHTNLFERDRIRTEKLDALLDNISLFWERRRWNEEYHSYLPADEASLALLCMHSAIKYYPAVKLYRLRQGYDICNILKKHIDESYFIQLCRSWHIEYYAYFSLSLTAYIFGARKAEDTALKLEPELSWDEKFLAHIHLRCYRSPDTTVRFYRMIYALCIPPILCGSVIKALRWYKEALLPPVWIQERRFGVSRTSPVIYLTYLYGPIMRIWNAVIRMARKFLHV